MNAQLRILEAILIVSSNLLPKRKFYQQNFSHDFFNIMKFRNI